MCIRDRGNVILEVLPQLGLFGVRLGAAVQQQEDVADRHHDGQVVHHVGAQTLLVLQRVQILTVDHVPGDPQLLVHTADHHALVHALVCAADEVAVQIQIHIVHALDIGQGLVHKDVVHIEGVLGQHHAALTQHLGAVHDRVHQPVSYTHLDVYKRQDAPCPRWSCPVTRMPRSARYSAKGR